MLKRLASRLLPAFALFSLALAAPSCKKSEAGSSDAPGGASADSDTAKADDGLHLSYKPGAKLKETGQIAIELSGPQAGGLAVDLVGTLDISDSGKGNNTLKVVYSVDEVRDLSYSGVFKPTVKEGETPKDPKETLLGSRGARIVDLLGNPDMEASKALPENKKPEGAGDDDATNSVGEFLGLPELPEVGLKLGEPITREREDSQNLGGLKIPMDIESIYTLVKIDESSGQRLAEISIETEGSGATEFPEGGGLLSIDQIADINLVFNLDLQLPVSLHVEQTTAFSAGSQGGGETQVKIDATFEVL
ncbi:MAG TPA: hypothetical protein ENJ18_10925 [Nannocystis exedens]|nr:hypothetical protein [Nannocystis exedens]